MSVIVSDTSPIRALDHLGLSGLLQQLYGEVLIPPAVADELCAPAVALPPLDWASIPGVRLQTPGDTARVQQLLQTLDRGEAEAIALAIEVHASAPLMDEREGRSVAASLGLTPVGVPVTRVRGKQERLLTAVRPLMDQLRSGLNFRISPALYAEILRLAGEWPVTETASTGPIACASVAPEAQELDDPAARNPQTPLRHRRRLHLYT